MIKNDSCQLENKNECILK